VAKLGRDPAYAAEFRQVFRRPVTRADLARALASYVRTIQSGDAPFDRYESGEPSALTAQERLGLRVFRGKGLCTSCHFGPTLSDERFHNTGVAWNGQRHTDEGRAAVTKNPRDRGAFKTPSLRDVARTAPYMHDGSFAHLEDVVAFYSEGGRANSELDRDLLPLRLNPVEQAALVAFLKSLSGVVTEGTLSTPRAAVAR
jgi:cytochrome c peroxidase